MLLTVSKRLEFSASRRLYVPAWSDAQNLEAFGPETTACYGTGRNYVAYFVFAGDVDPLNGMLVNISEIKERVEEILSAGFDHKFLNEDQPAFAEVPPTAENIARLLFRHVAPRFSDLKATLVACHLVEAPDRSATFYSTGMTEANFWFEFSAARQTMSPHLSAEENERLFAVASSPHGHGHNYRARLTVRKEQQNDPGPLVSYARMTDLLGSLGAELDHKNLNHEVPGLTNLPLTTESLARYIYDRAHSKIALHRVRLHERNDFFAEYWSDGNYFLGLRNSFSAAHRLHAPALSESENLALYGKCNNLRGHGHLYLTEATIGGDYDERSGTLYDFAAFQAATENGLQSWQNKRLDLEMAEFRDVPSTGENIVEALWKSLNRLLNDRLVRLRLWETPNNRFTLRKT